ncbi:(2Fe-2S) ferredoxin domain-containing protein [Hymenobacter sp. BT188]|uniref:(2Fe-2S) ferredoxin domain-containing protein n=1 Tax=Hymenobacter sp. BT188 TaxID=2763504 RepID=UPI0016516AB1|nr:(2Fe-2S) ferredoxin domain-containing protein [Hymenobacter sp. BT188]MBC6606860.1 (2Fe-2S) ferredoxin domain-containing protein [Hymenobacter sp. BT188]
MKYEHHLFVCTNQKSEVGRDVVKALKKEIKKQGLSKKLNRAFPTGCIDECKHCKKGCGAALIAYPEGAIYGDVQPADAPAIVREHLLHGRVVSKLLLD